MKKILLVFIISIVLLAIVKLRPEKLRCNDCNVILITLTNLRYDHLSGNGYTRQTTPNLDKLAKGSLVFDNAFSQSSWTLSEGISIFTSLYPYQHGVMNRFDGSTLSKSTPTLIDILNNNGYKTAGFTGGFDYDPRFGLTNRFGEYEGCREEGMPLTTLGYGKLDCALPKALDWIKNNAKSKFFIHIQSYDVHCPFSQNGGLTYDKNYSGTIDFSNCLWTFDKTNPIFKDGKKYYPVYSSGDRVGKQILLREKDLNHMIALYDESIKDSDSQIGTFLDEIDKTGISGKTIVIFTSEHGDMFGKYGRFMRGGPLRGTFYDDVLHIPLIMKVPGVNPGRFNELVEQIDIMPTILDFLGITKPRSLQGKSLIPALKSGKDIHQYVFAGSEYHPGLDNVYFNDTTRIESIRSKEWKLIKEINLSKEPNTFTYELFNLSTDEQELNNLSGKEKGILDALEKQLNDWSERSSRATK